MSDNDLYDRLSNITRLAEQPATAQLFATILSEIEFARLPMLQAFKKVMLGTKAILEPDCVTLGAGPREVDSLIDRIQAHEARLKRTARPRQEFFLRDLPRFDSPDRNAGPGRRSFTTEGIKYLFPRHDSSQVGFGIAVRYDDFAVFEVDDNGFAAYPEGKQLGARPFLVMPPDGMVQAAQAAALELFDHGGYGAHLPVFVKLYTDFISFVLQDHPALLAAHLLYRTRPTEAEQLLTEHDKLTGEIVSRVLYFLGYEPPRTASELRGMKRRDRDHAMLQSSGLRLFEVLRDWGSHCCKSLFLEGFVHSFRQIEVTRVDDLVAVQHERITAPPKR